MRKHPDIGADMIAQHSALTAVAPLVRHHHERWDGSGYPAGLKGDVIPFGARILSVADSFDTITGTRLYRRSLMTPLEGVEDISRRASHWYDPNVVDALRALHGMEPLPLSDRPQVPRRITAWNVLRSNPGFARLLAAKARSAAPRGSTSRAPTRTTTSSCSCRRVSPATGRSACSTARRSRHCPARGRNRTRQRLGSGASGRSMQTR